MNGLTADTSAHVNANLLQQIGARADKIAFVDRQIDFSGETFTAAEIKLSEGATISNIVSDVIEINATLKIGAYTLPKTDGSANQVLKTDGSGAVAWADDTPGLAYTLPAADGTVGQMLVTDGAGAVSWATHDPTDIGAYALPVADGTVGQVLVTDGAGALSWESKQDMGGYTLPSTDGTSGQVLKTDGSGAVTWQTP